MNFYIKCKIFIFQNCQMEMAKEGNLLHSMLSDQLCPALPLTPSICLPSQNDLGLFHIHVHGIGAFIAHEVD